MSSCAAADARPRVCVRSTMKKRRPSSFTRIPRAFTASAAVRRAMSSTLCASTTISAMSRLSSSWRAAPVCRCPRRMTASPVRASACWRSTAALRATSTRTSTPKRRRPPWPAATGRKSAACPTLPSAGSALATRRRTSAACCTTSSAAASVRRSWKPPASSSAAPRATSMTSSATASWCPSLMCAGPSLLSAGACWTTPSPSTSTAPRRWSTTNPVRFLH